ncbi:MAG: hypothetical protein Tsb0013_24290 [Phycisphaerales bacterium]
MNANRMHITAETDGTRVVTRVGGKPMPHGAMPVSESQVSERPGRDREHATTPAPSQSDERGVVCEPMC